MAIVGYKYDPEGVDAVYFAITDDYPKAARRIRWLLVIALVLSLVNVFGAMELSSALQKGTNTIARQFDAVDEDPLLRAALAKSLTERNSEEDSPLEGVSAEETLQMGRDVIAMLNSLSGLSAVVLLTVLVYFPLRYALLWWGVRRGHPDVLGKIRRTSKTQFWLELARMFTLWDMNSRAKILSLPNSWTWTLVVSVLILWYARSAEVREFFSVYETKRAPKDMPIPTQSTQGGLTSGRLGKLSEVAPSGEVAPESGLAPEGGPAA